MSTEELWGYLGEMNSNAMDVFGYDNVVEAAKNIDFNEAEQKWANHLFAERSHDVGDIVKTTNYGLIYIYYLPNAGFDYYRGIVLKPNEYSTVYPGDVISFSDDEIERQVAQIKEDEDVTDRGTEGTEV